MHARGSGVAGLTCHQAARSSCPARWHRPPLQQSSDNGRPSETRSRTGTLLDAQAACSAPSQLPITKMGGRLPRDSILPRSSHCRKLEKRLGGCVQLQWCPLVRYKVHVVPNLFMLERLGRKILCTSQTAHRLHNSITIATWSPRPGSLAWPGWGGVPCRPPPRRRLLTVERGVRHAADGLLDLCRDGLLAVGVVAARGPRGHHRHRLHTAPPRSGQRTQQQARTPADSNNERAARPETAGMSAPGRGNVGRPLTSHSPGRTCCRLNEKRGRSCSRDKRGGVSSKGGADQDEQRRNSRQQRPEGGPPRAPEWPSQCGCLVWRGGGG